MKKLFTILLVTLFAVNACGPTLESENEGWQKNLDAMNKLKTDYPVFTPLIDKKTEEAKNLWDEAQGISNEEQKLDKMVAANNVLEAGTMGNLRNMKSKISSLKSKKQSLMSMKTPDYKMESRTQNAFETVDKAIKKADKVLYMTSADFDINEASGKIDRAWNGLNDAYKEVEIIINNINKENNAIANEKAQKEQKLEADKKKAEEAKKDIKCPYCGVLNAYDYKKCKSCGAPREK
jgi:DNA repair exonuclease SbcCD ATPase subunit